MAYDPNKNTLVRRTTQPVKQQNQPQPAPSVQVQSSLPPMPATQPVQPVQPVVQPRAKISSSQQQTDPRFAQALARKLQADVAAKQTQLEERQKAFEAEYAKANQGVPAQQRISELLTIINAPAGGPDVEAQREAAVQEYQKLQSLQYQGPTGLTGAADIAALSQLAGSPELLAQQYGIGALGDGDVSGLVSSELSVPELSQALSSAESLAERALSEEEKAKQRSGLLKLLTEGTRTQAEAGIKSKEQEMLAGLSEAQQTELDAKKAAFDKIKEGLFLTGEISKNDLRKLGLNPDDPEVANTLNNLLGLDTSVIEGISNPSTSWARPNTRPTDLATLESRIKDLKRRQTEEGLQLTPEQQKLIALYNSISDLERDTTEGSAINYAKKEDLARINALRRLRGQELYTEEDLGKAGEIGKLSQSNLSELISQLREESKYGHEDRIEEMKEYGKSKLSVDKTLNSLYNKILSGGAKAGQYINELEKYAKKSHPWTYKRLQRYKDIFGWNADLVKAFAENQKNATNTRISDYENIMSPEKSAVTRKIKLT
jgi:hypothetical protein